MQRDRQCDLVIKEHLVGAVVQTEAEVECEISQSLKSLLIG